jgi:hypothetical protein
MPSVQAGRKLPLCPESGGLGFTPVLQLRVLFFPVRSSHMLPSLLHRWMRHQTSLNGEHNLESGKCMLFMILNDNLVLSVDMTLANAQPH